VIDKRGIRQSIKANYESFITQKSVVGWKKKPFKARGVEEGCWSEEKALRKKGEEGKKGDRVF